jgi:hypothetical protein
MTFKIFFNLFIYTFYTMRDICKAQFIFIVNGKYQISIAVLEEQYFVQRLVQWLKW